MRAGNLTGIERLYCSVLAVYGMPRGAFVKCDVGAWLQVGKHRDARKETEKKLQEITERLEDAEEATFSLKVAEDLEVRRTFARLPS